MRTVNSFNSAQRVFRSGNLLGVLAEEVITLFEVNNPENTFEICISETPDSVFQYDGFMYFLCSRGHFSWESDVFTTNLEKLWVEKRVDAEKCTSVPALSSNTQFAGEWLIATGLSNTVLVSLKDWKKREICELPLEGDLQRLDAAVLTTEGDLVLAVEDCKGCEIYKIILGIRHGGRFHFKKIGNTSRPVLSLIDTENFVIGFLDSNDVILFSKEDWSFEITSIQDLRDICSDIDSCLSNARESQNFCFDPLSNSDDRKPNGLNVDPYSGLWQKSAIVSENLCKFNDAIRCAHTRYMIFSKGSYKPVGFHND